MARFNGGWIKLYRSNLEIEAFKNDLELLGMWVSLLMMVCYKESSIDWKGRIRILEPGQILLTQRELVKRFGLSKTTILRRLEYLQKWDRIRTESGPSGTIVTICNWKEYQNSEELDGPQVDQEWTKSGPRVDLYKEVKKERNKNKSVGIRTNYPPEFNLLWEKYGKRGDKKEAYTVYNDLGLSPDESEQLGNAIACIQLNSNDWAYRKHFQRFLKTDWRELSGNVTALKLKTMEEVIA